MSLKRTSSNDAFAPFLLLLFRCFSYSVGDSDVLACVERFRNPNFQENDDWEVTELCSDNRQQWQPNVTIPIFASNLPRCVSSTSDLIQRATLKSYNPEYPADHFQALKNISDGNMDTCASTDFDTKGFLGLLLKSNYTIYAVRISTNVDNFKKKWEFPWVIVINATKSTVCNVCTRVRGPQLLDIYCPKGTVGDRIYVHDIRKEKAYFVICEFKIYLHKGDRRSFQTTVPTNEPTMAPEPSSGGTSKAVITITAALCSLVLLVITVLIVCIVHKKRRKSSVISQSSRAKIQYDNKSERVEINEVYEANDTYQQVHDYQPEYHIYNAVVYEEIGPRPDLLQSCDNIYSEPEDPESSTASLNQEASPNSAVSEVDTSIIRFKENEVYTIPHTKGTVDDNEEHDAHLLNKHETSEKRNGDNEIGQENGDQT